MWSAMQAAGVETINWLFELHFEAITSRSDSIGSQERLGEVKFSRFKRICDWKTPHTQWRFKSQTYSGGGGYDWIFGDLFRSTAPDYMLRWGGRFWSDAQETKTDPVKSRRKSMRTSSFKWDSQSELASCLSIPRWTDWINSSLMDHKVGLESQPFYWYGPDQGTTSKGPLELPNVHHQACTDGSDGSNSFWWIKTWKLL